jgi:hypothetical protein
MDGERLPVDSQRLLTLAEKFRDKRYRENYVAGHTRQVLARQMRNFRGELSQGEFGELIGKRQTVVSRLENPNYGAWQLRTMFEVARKLDLAVFARFVDFKRFLQYSNDLSDDALHPKPYDSARIDGFISQSAYNSEKEIGVVNLWQFQGTPAINFLWNQAALSTSSGPVPGLGAAQPFIRPDITLPFQSKWSAIGPRTRLAVAAEEAGVISDKDRRIAELEDDNKRLRDLLRISPILPQMSANQFQSQNPMVLQ